MKRRHWNKFVKDANVCCCFSVVFCCFCHFRCRWCFSVSKTPKHGTVCLVVLSFIMSFVVFAVCLFIFCHLEHLLVFNCWFFHAGCCQCFSVSKTPKHGTGCQRLQLKLHFESQDDFLFSLCQLGCLLVFIFCFAIQDASGVFQFQNTQKWHCV